MKFHMRHFSTIQGMEKSRQYRQVMHITFISSHVVAKTIFWPAISGFTHIAHPLQVASNGLFVRSPSTGGTPLFSNDALSRHQGKAERHGNDFGPQHIHSSHKAFRYTMSIKYVVHLCCFEIS
jgi:hypothetical protein